MSSDECVFKWLQITLVFVVLLSRTDVQYVTQAHFNKDTGGVRIEPMTLLLLEDRSDHRATPPLISIKSGDPQGGFLSKSTLCV